MNYVIQTKNKTLKNVNKKKFLWSLESLQKARTIFSLVLFGFMAYQPLLVV